MIKRNWFIYPLYPDRFHLGDQTPSGTCRNIADFTPQPCVTGAGDESPSEREAQANLKLAASAPRLFEAMKNLLECPDLNLDELEPDTETAIKEAHAALQAADTNEFVEPVKAGLFFQGLKIPDDWDTLTEDEKTRRLDAVIHELGAVQA